MNKELKEQHQEFVLRKKIDLVEECYKAHTADGYVLAKLYEAELELKELNRKEAEKDREIYDLKMKVATLENFLNDLRGYIKSDDNGYLCSKYNWPHDEDLKNKIIKYFGERTESSSYNNNDDETMFNYDDDEEEELIHPDDEDLGPVDCCSTD